MLHKLVTFFGKKNVLPVPSPPKTIPETDFLVTPEGVVEAIEQQVLAGHAANLSKHKEQILNSSIVPEE